MKRQASSIRAFGGKHQRLARALPMDALASQALGAENLCSKKF